MAGLNATTAPTVNTGGGPNGAYTFTVTSPTRAGSYILDLIVRGTATNVPAGKIYAQLWAGSTAGTLLDQLSLQPTQTLIELPFTLITTSTVTVTTPTTYTYVIRLTQNTTTTLTNTVIELPRYRALFIPNPNA